MFNRFCYVPKSAEALLGDYVRVYLNDDDCPNIRDRDAAARIIEEIVLNDVATKGSFVIEGDSAPGGLRGHLRRHALTSGV